MRPAMISAKVMTPRTIGATRRPLTMIQPMLSVTAAATRTMQRTTKTMEAVWRRVIGIGSHVWRATALAVADYDGFSRADTTALAVADYDGCRRGCSAGAKVPALQTRVLIPNS